MKSKIVHVTRYNDRRKIEREWWEVYFLKKGLFGKERWKVEKETHVGVGDSWRDKMEFKSLDDAKDYIIRASNGVPKRKITREEVE